DRVLGQRLDRVSKPAELLAGRSIEIPAALPVRVPLVEVVDQLVRDCEPARPQPCLVGAHRGEESPDLVPKLAADVVGMKEPFAFSVAIQEEAVEESGGGVSKGRSWSADRGLQVSDRERRIPRRVDAPVDIRGVELRATFGVQRVVLLVRVLAAREKASGWLAQNSIQVARGVVEDLG